MITVDTNIIIRLLTHDDDSQFTKSRKIFQTEALFIPDTIILETAWVLCYAYGFNRNEICDAFTKLFGLPNVSLSEPTIIAQAIQWHKHGLDFSDALHLAHSQRHATFLTFDRQFIQDAKGLCPCVVKKP